jgi:hypothetical protein
MFRLLTPKIAATRHRRDGASLRCTGAWAGVNRWSNGIPLLTTHYRASIAGVEVQSREKYRTAFFRIYSVGQ